MAGTAAGGREAFAHGAWADAYARLAAADGEHPLDAEDLELLAEAAALTGRRAQSTEAWARAHRIWLTADPARAVRAACRLASGLLSNGEPALGSGWLARTRRLVDDHGLHGAETGFLRYVEGLRGILGGEVAAAEAAFGDAARTGERHGDTELTTLARIGLGRCRMRRGEIAEGLALLDEAMVAVSAGQLPPLVVGDAYRTAIAVCREVFALRRAQTWTAELTRWYDERPSLVPYRGECLVHRSALSQLSGAWADAMAEADAACRRLAEPRGQVAIGAAFYQKAELHRLRGEFGRAEHAYREASRLGREPQPGLAQLRLAQGRVDVAVAAVRRLVEKSRDPVSRSRFLPVYVEVLLATRQVAAARRACRELAELAPAFHSDVLDAMVASAAGAVALAEHDAKTALSTLRRAARIWQDLAAPYELARVRTLLGLACRAVGDHDTAGLELSAAQEVFARLGAAPDRARVLALIRRGVPEAHGLTPRELEVLRLLSTGGHEQGHRRPARAQRPHRRPPRQQHPHQARRAQPRGGDRLCPRAPPGVRGTPATMRTHGRTAIQLIASCAGAPEIGPLWTVRHRNSSNEQP